MKTQTQILNDGFKTGENINAQKMIRFLAHEINNPLARIFMCVDELKKTEEENNENYFYVNVLGESGKTIERILIDFFNVTTAVEVKLKKRNLAELVKQNLSFAFEKTDHQLIKLVENYPNENIELALDEEKMTIALQNIIVNAIEAIGEKTGTIEIEVRKKENHVLILISDNGSGMSEEVLDNLFVPFYSTKPKRKGLGLAMANRIVVAHKGIVEVKSTKWLGTTVVISLPLY